MRLLVLILFVMMIFLILVPDASAHQSGCHRWHSCPSDTGSYVCGDLGYTSQCPSYYSPPKEPEISAPPLQTIPLKGTEFEITYTIISGDVFEMRINPETQSVIVTISSDSKGGLGILLPREVIDAKLGDNDSDFFVLADGKEIDYKEKIDSESRLLAIVYPAGTEEIEIIGTFVIPEFASFAMLVLLFSISGIVIASRKLKI